MNDPEYSESGAPIYRHQSRQRNYEAVAGDDANIQRIGEHIQRYVGKVDMVFHELVSDAVHIDVHIIPPDRERNYYKLITSGMSDKPMSVPEGLEECRYAELMICLPPEWKMTEEDFQDDKNYWPVRWLKFLARMPHYYETWLFQSHTIPNGDPPKPYADDTDFCCMLLATPVLFDDEFVRLSVNPEKSIHFLSLIPLYREETDFKLKHGVDALMARLEEFGVTELLQPGRPNVVTP